MELKIFGNQEDLATNRKFNYLKSEGIVAFVFEMVSSAFDFKLASPRNFIYSFFVTNTVSKNAN